MKALSRDLRPVSLAEVLPPRPGALYMTMGEAQWDDALAAAYRAGWVLLEVDQHERVVRAFQRASESPR